MVFSAADWNWLFMHRQLPEVHDKSLLGGLLFGGLGLLAGYRLLRFKKNIADAFALVLLLGVAVQRIGCFLTGCCFGKVSYLPWAVKYPVQTLPHYHQFNEHLLSYADYVSLPVHPVQLYEMTGLLVAAVFLLRAAKILKQPGSLFLLSGILLFVVRFITEFFRDPLAHAIGGKIVWIFNTTQFVLLMVIAVLSYLLKRRESKPGNVKVPLPDKEIPFFPALLFLSFVFVVFGSLKSWLELPEAMAMWFTLIAASGIWGYRFFMQSGSSPRRRLYPVAFILPLFLTAQTLPYGQQDSTFVKKFKSIKVGFASGNYENSYTIGHGSGCDRVSNTEYFQQKYTLAGVALEFTEQYPFSGQLSYGLETMIGKHHELRFSDNYEKNTGLFGITPYVRYDVNWVGFGGGLHIGNLSYTLENLNTDGYDYPDSGSKTTPVYPMLYMRFGPQKWLFADYHLADHFPSALPGFRHQIGLGTGLGLDNGTNLRMGFNAADMYYLSGYFPVENKLVLEPMLLWGNSPRTGDPHYQFSFGLSYRFGFGQEMRPK